MVGGLLVGATPVLLNGSPVYPDATGSWQIVAETRANIFGTGAAYLTGTEKAGLDPARAVDASALRSLISTGSPLPTSTWGWLHDVFDGRVRLESSSGGTDVCSALVSGSPWLPVYVGELRARVWASRPRPRDDAGRSVVGQVGELVIAEPMPSMPIYFWNDPDGSRYRDAYFSRFDRVRITATGSRSPNAAA